ncbi:MAG TPA: hypothetical protein VD794_12910 [Flavisolibacter sp.]|nr:hypothetical protein [Flavisolibacter sp.]
MNNTRRKELRQAYQLLEQAVFIIETANQEEQESLDNLSENLQASPLALELEENADRLWMIAGDINDAMSELVTVIGD